MKPHTHPKYYPNCKVFHNGDVIMTVGATVPEMHVEVWSGSHPFFTGKRTFVDTAGRVELFQRKFEGRYFGGKIAAKRVASSAPTSLAGVVVGGLTVAATPDSLPQKSIQSLQVADDDSIRSSPSITLGKPPPMSDVMARIQQRVLHVRGEADLAELYEALQSGRAHEAYVQAGNLPAEEVLRLAKAVIDRIKPIPNLFQPLVFGPLDKLDAAGNRFFAKNRIAISPLSYSQYCKSLAGELRRSRGSR